MRNTVLVILLDREVLDIFVSKTSPEDGPQVWIALELSEDPIERY